MSHFPICTSIYPEKVPGETAQQLQRIDLGEGDWVKVCVDCGAVIAQSITQSYEEEQDKGSKGAKRGVMGCAKCGHPREKHENGKCDDSRNEHGVFQYRPCKCPKWVKPKVKR